jgi:hypothetical protein
MTASPCPSNLSRTLCSIWSSASGLDTTIAATAPIHVGAALLTPDTRTAAAAEPVPLRFFAVMTLGDASDAQSIPRG